MIKSKYKPLQLFFSLFFGCFFIAIAVLLYRINAKTHPQTFKGYIGPFALGFFGVYMPYLFFQRSPRVAFNDDFIIVKYFFTTKTFAWNSIKDVFFSKKEYYSMLLIFGQDFEATTIHFDDNAKLILWEDMYNNLAELKGIIKEKVNDKIKDPKSKIVKSNLLFFDKRNYKGNPWTSINGIMLIGMISFWGYYIVTHPAKQNILILIPLFMCLFFYLFFGIQMNYFTIDAENLIIKNHFFPWKNKLYNLNDISEFVIESPYRRSNSLRIITKEFRSKLFGAGSLRDKHWREFRDDIIKLGIPVRADTSIG